MADVELSPNEIVDLFNEVAQNEKTRSPRGFIAEQVREDVRAIIRTVKQPKISLAMLRKTVVKMMKSRAQNAGASQEDIDKIDMEQAQFSGIVTRTWKVEKDPETQILMVFTDEELPPKVHEPKKAKGKGKKGKKDDSLVDDEQLA